MINETQKKIGPDDLLVNIGKSIMFKAMVLSILGHVIFTGATSISLWQDWASDWERFGLKAPGTINAIKGEDRKIAEEKKRKEEAAAKAEAEAKEAKRGMWKEPPELPDEAAHHPKPVEAATRATPKKKGK